MREIGGRSLPSPPSFSFLFVTLFESGAALFLPSASPLPGLGVWCWCWEAEEVHWIYWNAANGAEAALKHTEERIQ